MDDITLSENIYNIIVSIKGRREWNKHSCNFEAYSDASKEISSPRKDKYDHKIARYAKDVLSKVSVPNASKKNAEYTLLDCEAEKIKRNHTLGSLLDDSNKIDRLSHDKQMSMESDSYRQLDCETELMDKEIDSVMKMPKSDRKTWYLNTLYARACALAQAFGDIDDDWYAMAYGDECYLAKKLSTVVSA